jgi:hypothetical protein
VPPAFELKRRDGEPARLRRHPRNAPELLRRDRERLAARKPFLGNLRREAARPQPLRLPGVVPLLPSCDQLAALRVLRPDRRARRAQDRRRTVDDELQRLFERAGTRQLAAELEQRRRALRLAPLRLVEPRVLERDRRLAGQHLEQPRVVLVELVEAELGDDDDPVHVGAVAERRRKQRLLDRLGAGHGDG